MISKGNDVGRVAKEGRAMVVHSTVLCTPGSVRLGVVTYQLNAVISIGSAAKKALVWIKLVVEDASI